MSSRTLVTAVLLALLAVAPTAGALVEPAEVARADVAVEPGAPVTPQERQALADAAARLRAEGAPTKFVVLALRPVDPIGYAARLRQATQFSGTVLVLSLQEGARGLWIASPVGSRRANAAYQAELPRLRADPVSGTIAVAGRLARAGDASGGTRGTGGAGGGWGLLVLLGLFGAGAIAVTLFTRRRVRHQGRLDVREQREALEPLVDALASKVTALDADMPLAGDRAAAARADADEATLAYGEARDALPGATTAGALAAVRTTLERGLRAAQRAEAALEGRPAPAEAEEPLLGGLCAFDPSHGRAVTTARITTPSGDDAEVPVCAADAEALAEGRQPGVRTVSQGGRQVPYWQGAGLGGFGGSLFPVLGGVFGGLLLYDLLTPDISHAAPMDTGWGGDAGAGGDFGSGGDLGGGDFGGGGDF